MLSIFLKKGLNYDYLVSCFLANDTSDAFVFVYDRVLCNVNITILLHHYITISPYYERLQKRGLVKKYRCTADN
jgi:hypothetical protein